MLEVIRKGGGFEFASEGKVIPARVEMYVKSRRNVYDVYLENNNEERVLSARLTDIPESTAINFKADVDWTRYLQRISVSVRNDLVLYRIKIDASKWTEPFTIPEYLKKLIEVIKNSEKILFELKSISENDLTIYTNFSSDPIGNGSIDEKIRHDLELLQYCHEFAIKEFITLSNRNVQALFSFPEQVRIPCEQYLLYFVQFLRDLGINTISNLKEESGKVLFSITPLDANEALDRIYEALRIYLKIPSNSLPISGGDSEVEMILSGTRANSSFFQAQLELEKAKVQFKNATIEQNQLAIQNQNEIIRRLNDSLASNNIIEESLEKIVVDGEIVDNDDFDFTFGGYINAEAEELTEGEKKELTVGSWKFYEITKFREYGVGFNLPNWIRERFLRRNR